MTRIKKSAVERAEKILIDNNIMFILIAAKKKPDGNFTGSCLVNTNNSNILAKGLLSGVNAGNIQAKQFVESLAEIQKENNQSN